MTGTPGQIAFGAFLDSTDPAAIAAFGALVGRQPAGVTFYLFRSNGQPFPKAQCDAVHSRGAAPIVAIRQDGMAPADVAAGRDDAYWIAWARAAAAWERPIYLRFDWEMNIGLVHPPADWMAQWRHLVALFDANGAGNVVWVWNPNVEYYGTTDIGLLYPGSQWVDWVALDGYNWGHTDQYHWWSSFTQVFQASYARLRTVAPDKPIMICEFSSADNGGDKGAWIRSALALELPQSFPFVRAVTWFNADKRPQGEQDWRVDSSAGSLAGMQAALAAMYQPAPIIPPAAPRYGGTLA